MDFQPGNVVQLKSGGLPMTVVRVEGGEVECLYFGELGDELLRAKIPAFCLDQLDLAELEPEPPPPQRGPMRDRPRPHHR